MSTFNYPQYGYRRWKSPVATSAALPSTGNVTGDARVANDTGAMYVWTGSSWVASSGAAITQLTGDVSATGPGVVASTVNSVGGSTAANIHTAEVAANAATSANTVSTLVARDGSGNFSAGTVSLSGLNLSGFTGLVTASGGALGFQAAGTTSQYWRGDLSRATLNQAAVAGLTTADSPTFAGLTVTGSSGLVKSTAGVVGSVAAGTSSQYVRGDLTMQTLNQSTVAGLTTADSPTFNGLVLTGSSGILKSSGGTVGSVSLGTTAEYWRGDLSRATLNQGAVAGLTTSDSPTFAGLTLSTQLSVGNGGTGKTSVTTAPAATSWAGWDANSNISANNVLESLASTSTAAGTTTLTVSSAFTQVFTGTSTQTVTLPVATTLVNGQSFCIVNQSTGAVTVQTSGANTVQAMAASSQMLVTCVNTAGGTGTASWTWNYSPLASVAVGSSAQYLRGDQTYQTLNQAAVAGLTTGDSPTFNGLTASNNFSQSGSTGSNSLAAPTSFTNTTNTTSGGSGAVYTAGGVGITKDLYVGGSVINGTWVGTAVAATHGGTGLTSATTGDLIYASGANTWANLAAGASTTFLKGGTTPSWATLNQAAVAGLTTSSTPTFNGVVVANSGTGVTTLNYYQEGTFTATASGITGSPTCTAVYVRIGSLVSIAFTGNLIAVGTSSSFSITGLPSQLTPSHTQTVPFMGESNGASITGAATISGTSISLTPTVGGGTWTTSAGNNGFFLQTLTYVVN